MSAYATAWVWRNSKTTGQERLLLLAIADSADSDSGGTLPDFITLAQKCRLPNERAVDLTMRGLIELGEIALEPVPETGVTEFSITPILNEEYR
jgi:hypothetical protein